MKMTTGFPLQQPKVSCRIAVRAAKLSVGNEIGLPFDHQRARPRADTIMPSVAMKGGILV